MADQVVIEFIVDTTQIESAIDLLEKIGQVDAKTAADFKKANAEINKQSSAIKATAAATVPLKKSIEDVNRATKSMTASFMQGFEQGVIESLKEAGVTLDEFLAALKNGPQVAAAGTESLRQRLKNLTQQLGELKLSGQDNTEQFKQLRDEAAKIKDAMADAGAEIQNVASDTRTFDNLLGSAQAVAGGFAIAQGTAALFGDESEELQKTLLKVNAAMAILQGLQSIQNALQKEGAITQLLSNKQRIITNAQLAIENGLTSTSIVVRAGATVAQKALNLAMAANPFGIFALALAGVITLLATYASNAKAAAIETAALNAQLASSGENLQAEIEGIRNANEKITEQLENAGSKRSEILENNLRTEQIINERRISEAEALRRKLDESQEVDPDKVKEGQTQLLKLEQDAAKAQIDIVKKQNDLRRQLRDEDLRSQIATTESSLQNAGQGTAKQLELQQKLISLQSQAELNAAGLTEAEKTAIATKAIRDRLELQIAFNKRQIDLELKAIEARLINVRQGSQEEFNLKIEQLRLQVQSEIQSTKLSEAEKKIIKEKGFQDQLQLQREFNAQVRKEDIEAQISRNNAELANVKISAEDKLLLTISNLELTAALEIDAAKENTAKIKEINAERDAQIAAARKASIEQQTQQEIDLINAVSGAENRALDKIIADEKKATGIRIAAIHQRADFDLRSIDIREQALEDQLAKGLVSEREYNVAHERLQDEKAQVAERTEERITDIYKTEAERRKEIQRQNFENAVQVSTELLSVLDGLNQLQAERDQQRIEAERARVQELLESGAITEKESIARNKRIDAEEKKLKREQAQRDKALAIFNAIIATAQGVVRALAVPPAPNVVLAAIMGALGAAQTAIIAARPIPKFRTGKKNQYEGPGIIGEAGQEIFEHAGKHYLAHKETLVWLGKQDKVYTPSETKQMLPHVDKQLLKQQPTDFINSEAFAHTVGEIVAVALAKEIKKIPQSQISIDNEGFMMHIKEGLSRTSYMDKKYSSK